MVFVAVKTTFGALVSPIRSLLRSKILFIHMFFWVIPGILLEDRVYGGAFQLSVPFASLDDRFLNNHHSESPGTVGWRAAAGPKRTR